ncbi:MAG: YXWGXW repeat-containing protein [Polyangiaceae bacterium]|nr:hypothetical protein [Polyangiaceae bacterium]NUQ73816.1 YXWGXW repeat-containing protein [Polyangiaceae bacterium]
MNARRISLVGISAAASAAAALGLAGCGYRIPVAPSGPHTGDEPTYVPFPHPAAKPEIIPPIDVAGENAVWVDGEWEWKGTRWVWQPGRWETPYPGSYYARPVVVRMPDGRLAWYRGTWHSAAPK